MKYLFCFTLLLGSAFAVDMPEGSEQFYVVQGVFDELGAEAIPCWMQDARINFACGSYEGTVEEFKTTVDTYIANNLPGLRPIFDWFQNATSTVHDYRSVNGGYYFVYNADGTIVISFTPR